MDKTKLNIPIQIAIQAAIYQKDYYSFFKEGWKILEPTTPLDDNWHIKYLCDRMQYEVERIGRGENKTKDILVNISPRSLKSSIITIILNAWTWINYPHLKFVNASYSGDIAVDHAVKTRRLIESHWYQSLWQDKFKMTSDQNVKSLYENDKSGTRKAVGVGGSFTGAGGDILLVDDPINPLEANSEAEIKNSIEWYKTVFYSRLNNQKVGIRIIIMQRVHENDLSGYILANDPDGYEHICIPGDSDYPIKPKELEKYYVNGLFSEKRFDQNVLNSYKKVLQSNYAAQIGQQPANNKGNILNVSNVNFYKERPEMHEFDFIMQSWDLTFKDKKENDFVAGQVWAVKGSRKYLLYRIKDLLSFTKCLEEMRHTSKVWHMYNGILVEDKANGSAIMDVLKDELTGIIPINPTKDKLTRAYACSPEFEAGNIWVPDPTIASWVVDYLTELKLFPKAKHDDEVDCTTQFLNYIRANPIPTHLDENNHNNSIAPSLSQNNW